MNFRFYIFGIPEGFDLYPNRGNSDEIKYFQLFYDGSSENTKLTIRHSVNGKVSYSYLKYKNVISGGGRSGAFFGMSIVFENEYCTDVTNLLQLFETVYTDILQKGILLKKLSNTQTRFAVSKLADAETEINRVENIIKVNLESQYANDLKPIDFPIQSNQNVIFKLNSEKRNTDILSKLKQYASVSISPEYPKDGEEVEIIPQEILDKLFEKIDDLDKQKQAFLFDTENTKISNLVTVRNSLKGEQKKTIEKEIKKVYADVIIQISVLLQKCDAILVDLKKNLQDFPKNSVLLELQEYVNRQKLIFDNQKNTIAVFNDLISSFGQPVKDHDNGDDNKNDADKDDSKDKQPNRISIFWNKHKSGLIAAAFILVIVISAVCVFEYYSKELAKDKVDTTKPKTFVPTAEELEKQGRTALEENKFDEAIDKFTKSGKMELVENAKSQAVQYWREQAANAKKPNEAIELIVKTKKYGGYTNLDNDIAEFQKQIDDVAEMELQKLAAKQKKNKEKKDERMKEDTKDSGNACIITKQFDSANSKISWTVSELLTEAKIKLDAGSYVIVIDMCKAIVDIHSKSHDCATAKQVQKAESYIRQAESLKN